MYILPIPFFPVLVSIVHLIIDPYSFHHAVHLFMVQFYIYILPYLSYLHYYNSINLCLAFKSSTKNTRCLVLPPSDSTTPAPSLSGVSWFTCSTSSLYAVSADLDQSGYQNHCLPQVLPSHRLPTELSHLFAAATAPSSAPISSGASLPLPSLHHRLVSTLTSYKENTLSLVPLSTNHAIF